MAEAHLALWGDLPGLRKLVVVKRILPHLSSNKEFVRMFFDEARISALLDHPNIPRVIEVGQDDDGYFLAMEAVSGKPLSAILRKARRRERPLGQAYAAFIVGRAAAGLGYAHALTDAEGRPLHIVHRDVSPENILVSFEGSVKLIDFGIARAHGRLSETLVGGLKGKVQYMSPEQASGAPVDRRSDVFSLGIVLWEALSGKRLFQRETDLGVMRAITDEPIPRPSGPLPIPARLEEIVMTALEKAPDHRFQDAQEMALLLERHAFRTDGFDPAELVAQVTQLFPTDHAAFKATVAMAQGIEGRGPREITATFPLLEGVGTGTSPATGRPTLALHKPGRQDESVTAADASVTEADAAPAFASEPPLELDGPSLSPLASWGGAQQEPASDSGSVSSRLADEATPPPLRTPRSLRGKLSGPLWLLVGAVASAAVFASLRGRANSPAAAPAIVEAPARVVTPARVETPAPSEPPLPTPAAPAAPAASATTAQIATPLAPPDHARPVKSPPRKHVVAQRAPTVAKPEPTPEPTPAPEASPPNPSIPRPGWSDPFE